MMSSPSLRQTLKKLHQEIERTDPVDAEEQALLQHLMSDIQELIDREEAEPESGFDQLNNRLRTAILKTEVSHPTLTLMMGKALDALSNAGI
jgi:hypothetical protein